MKTVAFSMTIDPEGAMHDWVDLPEGWALLPVPTQEAVHLLGPRAYQELLVDLAECERPALLVTHPPYDWLGPATADRLRAAGTRVLGYAFDDELFAASYGPATWEALARTYDRYVTTHDVLWASAPLPSLPEREPEHDVVLVGRAYPRRRALVEALRNAGLSVAVRGHGWPEGFAPREEMLELYSRAAVVLTTADWEHRAVPMVKHRLLEAAQLGVFQVAQDAPDLRRYFSADEVPSFRDAAELITVVRAALADPAGRRARARAARQRALAEHTWTVRFAELCGPLAFADPPPGTKPGHSLLFDQLILALASRAEADGRVAAAAALARVLLARQPDEPTAAAILGRCLRDQGRSEAALPWLRLAAAAEATPCAAALHAALPHCGVGTGLGRLGLLPPAAEPTIHQLAALLALGRTGEALALLDGLGATALARAVAATVDTGGDPTLAAVRERLARMRSGQGE